MKKHRWILAVAMLVIMSMGVDARAEEVKGRNLNEGWKFEITPYVWLAGIDTDVTVNGQTKNITVDFSDLQDYVTFGGSVLGVVRKDRLVFWTQVDYFALEADPTSSVEYKIDQTFLEAAVGYQFPGLFKSTMDVMVGVRYAYIDQTLSGTPAGNLEKTTNITDPMFVLRSEFHIWKMIYFQPTLGIGGGGDSDLIYELQPAFEFQINKCFDIRAGYRQLYYDYKTDNNNEFDGAFTGMILGAGFTF